MVRRAEQQDISHWVSSNKVQIDKKWKLYHSGFYEQENLPVQGMYISLALFHASLAGAKYLDLDPIEDVRIEFARASRCILKSFTMAYDDTDSDYQGEKSELGCTSEGDFIEGINYALMAADFDLAKELATWFRDPVNGKLMDAEINNYAHSLKSILVEDRDAALTLLKRQMDAYDSKPPKKRGYRKNYQTLTTALYGIADKNEKLFNQGLRMQLEFYQSYAEGEAKNTSEEFICDQAVALANLGIHNGLKVSAEQETLPKGLLMDAVS